MRRTIADIVPVVLITMVLIFPSLLVTGNDVPAAPGSPDITRSPYVASDSIRINSNSELRTMASQNGWEGSGAPGDPFIIEDLIIEHPTGRDCLYIGNTTDHVIVRNSTFRNVTQVDKGSYTGASGVFLNNVDNVNLSGNDCSFNKDMGIKVAYSQNLTMERNNCSGNGIDGIYVFHSEKVDLNRNNCSRNSEKGINLFTPDNPFEIHTNVIGNVLSENFIGIKTIDILTMVHNNTVVGNDYGIYLSSAERSRVWGNELTNNSLSISDYYGSGNLIFNNTMDRCRNLGIEVDRSEASRVEGNRIIDGGYGIKCFESSVKILTNIFQDQRNFGLSLERCRSTLVRNNTILNVRNNGMELSTTPGVVIDGNTLWYCGIKVGRDPIEIVTSLKVASNNTVNGLPLKVLINRTDMELMEDLGQIVLLNCTNMKIGPQNLINCSFGVTVMHSSNVTISGLNSSENYIGALFYLSDEVRITDSIFMYNKVSAFTVENGKDLTVQDSELRDNVDGIYISGVKNLSIHGLVVFRGGFSGITVYGSNGVSIRDNHISACTNYGINLGSTNGNVIVKNNTFVDIGFYGIYLNCHGTRMINNTFTNCFIGIALYYCQYTQISDSNMTNCGIMIVGGGSVQNWILNEIDDTNMVNGKPVIFIKNQSGGSPRPAGQVIVANSSFVQVAGQDLQNCSIGVQIGHCRSMAVFDNNIKTIQAINIQYSTDVVVWRNTIRSDVQGIYLSQCTGTVIAENDIKGGTSGGITSGYSYGTIIEENIIYEGYYSINGYFYQSTLKSNVIVGGVFGIQFDGAYSVITSNRCTDMNNTGIMVSGTYNNISMNICTGSIVGIHGSNVRDTIFENNSCRYNNIGIRVYSGYTSAGSVTIRQNTVTGNDIGIHVYGETAFRIEKNYIDRNSDSGIFMDKIRGSTMYDNVLIRNGLWIEGVEDQWKGHKIPENNTVNGFPIKYLSGKNNQVITDRHDQIILAGCANIEINGHMLTNSTSGILTAFSENLTIRGTSFYGMTGYGLYSHASRNIHLDTCNFLDNSNGLYAYKSKNLNISNSLLRGNLESAVYLENCEGFGLYNDSIENNGLGAHLELSDAIDLSRSEFAGNSIGVNIDRAFTTTMTFCSIKQNGIGVNISGGSENNRFHHNDFVDNRIENAIDSGQKNQFDDNIGEGNHWSDYRDKFPSAVSNGKVWSIPYSIYDENGTLNSLDRYPLVGKVFHIDIHPPEIIDLTPDVAYAGENLTFHVELLDYSGIMECRVEYNIGYGADPIISKLSRVSDVGWKHTIYIPDAILPLIYRIDATDNLFYRNVTLHRNVTIMDREYPLVPFDTSDQNATTGDPFVFRARSDDNIEVVLLEVEYWFGDGESRYMIIAESKEGELEITIPWNSTDRLHYILSAEDSSGNRMSTQVRTVNVVDNDPPTAEAGNDMMTNEGDMAFFNGEESTDNVGIVSYTWTLPYLGGRVNLEGSSTAFRFQEPGAYIITLTVRDAFGNADADTVNLLVIEGEGEELLDVKVGPVMDTEFVILEGVIVTIKLGNRTWNDATGEDGLARFRISSEHVGSTLNITLSKKDYHPVQFDAVLNADGSLTGELPLMERIDRGSGDKGSGLAFLWIVLVIIVILGAAAGIFLFIRSQRNINGEGWETWEE
ncbi:MAG: NosD domain-containing protein [Thermoplasmatota archaeon]